MIMCFFLFLKPALTTMSCDTDGLGDCSVCLSALLGSDDSIATTKCGHVYHYRCIIQSMEYKSACPNCCGSLKETDVFKMANTYNIKGSNDIVKNDTDIHNLNKQVRVLTANVKTLASELKKSEAKRVELEEESAKTLKKSSDQHQRLKSLVRDNADLWEQINSLKKEKVKLQEVVTVNGYKTQIEEGGIDKALESVLNSGEAVKNHYIKDLHKLLTTANKTTAKLQDHNKNIEERLNRYKEKYRIASAGLSTSSRKTPVTTTSNLSPETRKSLEDAARRLEQKAARPSKLREKSIFGNPQSVLAQQEDPRAVVSRKRSFIAPQTASGSQNSNDDFNSNPPEVKKRVSRSLASQTTTSEGTASPELFRSASSTSFCSELPSVKAKASKLPTPSFSLPPKKPSSGNRYRLNGSLCGPFTPL
eukprot:TRINITY_DN3106_c0_g1_i1.p1 TRINITY_DN3106_c0_g1~~TRINITY_DN3106_c0_g1_i1.p1  ORF type:complete len:420 (+),score=71.21 TRINITY_DN3106_c0_g1_i1:46-1305(+)